MSKVLEAFYEFCLLVVGLGALALMIVAFYNPVTHAVQSVIECPVHVTIDGDRRCISVGIGR